MPRPRRMPVDEADAPCWAAQHSTTSRGPHVQLPTDGRADALESQAPHTCGSDYTHVRQRALRALGRERERERDKQGEYEGRHRKGVPCL